MIQKCVYLFDSRQNGADPAEMTARQLRAECPSQTSGVCDLSRILVLLPGRQAVRAVSGFLVKQGPVFPPDFMTPGVFRFSGVETIDLASRAEQKSLWMDVLNQIEPETYPALFPRGFLKEPAVLSYHADQIIKLRKELELSDVRSTIRKASELLAQDDPRWEELAALEDLYLQALAGCRKKDPAAVLQEALQETDSFTKYEKIIAALTPDLPPVVKARLAALEKRFAELRDFGREVPELKVYIAASESERELFDEWGCVIPEKWTDRALPFGEAAGHFHAVPGPGEMGDLAVCLAPDPETGTFDLGKTVIAAADPAFVPVLAHKFSQFHIGEGTPLPVYDPAGVSMSALRLVPLIRVLRAMTAGTELSADPVYGLLQHEDALDWLAHSLETSPDFLLKQADQYYMTCLPDTVRADKLPQSCESSRAFLDFVSAIREKFLKNSKPLTGLKELLTSVFYHTSYPLKNGISLEQEAAEFNQVLSDFTKSTILSSLPLDKMLFLLEETLSGATVYPEHDPDSLEIIGFLDMPFHPADRVILCGMNEGLLPETLAPTPYLTDARRERLGLPGNASRYARDCFYLQNLLIRTNGNVHFLACRHDSDGAPLRLSSLFFSGCTDEELLKRTAVLYEPFAEQKQLAGEGKRPFSARTDLTHAFLNKDGQLTLSVTTFASLLASPFRTFLDRDRQMDEEDYEAMELDAARLGTCVHAALQHFEPEREWLLNARSGDEKHAVPAMEAAADALYELFLTAVHEQIGDVFPLLPLIQTEMWEQRIRKTAKILVKESREVLAREWKLNGGNGIEWEGACIKGVIDRIEYDRMANVLRLIDFKTGIDAENPKKAHIIGKRFINLQLPLYRILLPLDPAFAAKFPDIDLKSCSIQCGYFAISKTVKDIQYVFWDDMESCVACASATAREVLRTVRAMQQGELREDATRKVSYDHYTTLYPPDLFAVFGESLNLCKPPDYPEIEKKAPGKAPAKAKKGGKK